VKLLSAPDGFVYPCVKSYATMLTTGNTRTFHTDAATAASVRSCRHSVDQYRRPGYVMALAGRCAR
jgi:hypothetical protein